jgi:hypothetical protein
MEWEVEMRMFGQVALLGFSGVVLWKVLGILFLPMVGALLKLALIMLVGYAVLTLFKRSRCKTEDADD